MSKRCSAAALAAVLASLVAACSAAEPRTAVSTESAVGPAGVTVPSSSGGVTVPAGTGATVGSGSGTSGPGEKEKQRGNTPPGMSRDGAGPAGGAIIAPATGTR
jgi:hypothetical protein